MVRHKHITILKAIKGTLINTIGDRRRDFKAGANPLIVNEFLKRIYHPYNGPTFCSRNKDYGDIVDLLLHLGKARRRECRRFATSKIEGALSEDDKARVRCLGGDPSLSAELEFPTLKMAGITMDSSLIDGHAPAQPVEDDVLNQSEKSYYEDGDDTDGEDVKWVNQPETRPVEVVAADDHITSVARGEAPMTKLHILANNIRV